MSSLTGHSVFSGPLLTILAGEGEKALHAHANVLSESETLRVMIEGDWKESKESQIFLRDWDEDTVSRVLDWLYTGDYKSPFPRRQTSYTQSGEEAVVIRPLEPSYTARPAPEASNVSKSTPIQIGAPTGNLDDIEYEAKELARKESNFLDFIVWAQKHSGEASALNHAEPLMAHAKVYALAGYFLLRDLKLLAAKRLRASVLFIGAFQAGSPAVDDVALVAKYIYTNTNAYKDGKPEEEEPLRRFISGVIATHFKHFVGEGPNQVLHEGGDLVMDICQKMRAQAVIPDKDDMSPFRGMKRAAPDAVVPGSGKKASRAKGSAARVSKVSRIS
ncbi:MAG: hypothetical protein Q9217_001271 [Psora testacea]